MLSGCHQDLGQDHFFVVMNLWYYIFFCLKDLRWSLFRCTRHQVLLVFGGLYRLSGGSSWRCYHYPFTPPAPVGSLPAAHAETSPGRRPGYGVPPVRDSHTPRRAAGLGAHRVSQGLTVTAAPTSDPHSSSVSPVYGVGSVGCPQCQLTVRSTVSICAYVRSV